MGQDPSVLTFDDRDTVAAAVMQASSRQEALILLGVANPGPTSYRRLAEACELYSLPLPAPASSDRVRTEKLCRGCQRVLAIESFALKNEATGRRQSRCRQCHSGLRRGHYISNRAKIRRQIADRKREVRLANMERIIEYLTDHPCIDCGETDLLVLQFDHVTGTKSADVMAMIHLVREKVAAEIAKCVVRCANCHTRKTAAQFGWLRAAVAQQVGHLPSKQA